MEDKKIAFITGVTGQDGAYLSDFLLNKNYKVHGLVRHSSVNNLERVDYVLNNNQSNKNNFYLHYGDMTDSSSLNKIIGSIQPSEIYNLAAQSHVKVSFDEPEYTANSDAIGPLRILESIKNLGLINKTKYYQASTSELYGLVQEIPQKETTPFYPRSPYGVAKLYAYWITKNYRESYGMYACNGILFNHESPLRGELFVTRKIIQGMLKIKYGLQEILELGNIDAKRDWGHAKDYVEAMWLMLQQDHAEDYVIATGKQYSIRQFIEIVGEKIEMPILWKGSGENEKGFFKNKCIISINRKYYRPAEVETLLGDASLARKQLGWEPKIELHTLIDEMINFDSAKLKNVNK